MIFFEKRTEIEPIPFKRNWLYFFIKTITWLTNKLENANLMVGFRILTIEQAQFLFRRTEKEMGAEGGGMPLTLAGTGVALEIKKIGGSAEMRQHL